MLSGVHGGVKTIEGTTSSTPSSSPTNSFICSETWGPIGHAGVVRVKVMLTVPPSIADVVDETELDEVETQLGVDDVGERLGDVVFADHSSSLEAGVALALGRRVY